MVGFFDRRLSSYNNLDNDRPEYGRRPASDSRAHLLTVGAAAYGASQP